MNQAIRSAGRILLALFLLVSLRGDGWNFHGSGTIGLGGFTTAPAPQASVTAVATVTLSAAANTSSTTDLTEYTFSGVAFSTAAADRRVVVGVSGSTGTASVASMTIGGVSAALLKAQAAGDLTAELWQAAVPTGATGDIVVTWSAGQLRTGIGVWAAYGASATPHDTCNDLGDDPSDTVNVIAHGAVIAYAANDNGGGQVVFDAAFEGVVQHSGASDEFAAAETGRTVTAGIISFGTNSVMVCASLQPG